MSDFADKLRAIGISRPSHRAPKVTVDDHGTHTVEVTEHWHDRQDVTVKPPTHHAKVRGVVHGY